MTENIPAETSFFMRLTQTQWIRFAAVGLVSTCFDVGTLKVLFSYAHWNITPATALAFLVGLTVGFLLNGRFVFKQSHTVARYIKYGLVSLGGLLLTELIIYLLYTHWQFMGALSAKLVAVVLVFFWNYTWSRLWAFK